MIRVSFEFFPPKTEEMEVKLWKSIHKLLQIKPEFMSVTYGAGGTTRQRTYASVCQLVEKTPINIVAHLTCVGACKQEVKKVIDDYASAGVTSIMALRGDMPNMDSFISHADGYASSLELIRSINRRGQFNIFVSAYPERHPESLSWESDIDFLKAKIDAGASCAVTQFALDTEVYLRFRDRLVSAGVNIPVIPGIMPTSNFTNICRMAKLCAVHIPDHLFSLYEGLEDDLTVRQHVAVNIAFEQCQLMMKEGFQDFHFYTLNQADVSFAVCRLLGLG